MIICSDQLSVRTCVLGHWSWHTPCAERIAFRKTMVPSPPLRDFPNREQLGTTVNEHSSSLPLSTSLISSRDATQCKQEIDRLLLVWETPQSRLFALVSS